MTEPRTCVLHGDLAASVEESKRACRRRGTIFLSVALCILTVAATAVGSAIHYATIRANAAMERASEAVQQTRVHIAEDAANTAAIMRMLREIRDEQIRAREGG